MKLMSHRSVLLWATVLPTLTTSFFLAPPPARLDAATRHTIAATTTTSLALSPASTTDTNDDWNETVIAKLQAWAAEMQQTFATENKQRRRSRPRHVIHRTNTNFVADIKVESTAVVDADAVDIRLVTVGQQPVLTVSIAGGQHQGVALDGTVDLDTLTATLLPGNVLRITGDKKEPRSSGLRIPVVDQR